MKKVLKIGDKIYTQSLQHFAQSYLVGFPQREQYLLKYSKEIEFDFFKHKIMKDIDVVTKERERLRKFLSNRSFDYLMIDNPLSNLIIGKEIKTPIIFDCIDWYDEMYLKEFGVNEQYYLLRYSYLDILKKASKVIAQSPVILEAMKNWGLKTKDTIIIPNGYDSSLFYPYSSARIALLKKYFEKKHKVDLMGKEIIMYCGKVGKWYDNLKVISEAIDDRQVFFVVGDGPLLKEIPNRKNIIKCGMIPIEKVPDYMNIADVFVFPVEVDCSPIVISEYLAIGTPIVMGKGRMEWLLKDGKTGRMVDGNVFSWKEGIRSALKLKYIVKKSNIKLAKDLSWQELSKKLLYFVEK